MGSAMGDLVILVGASLRGFEDAMRTLPQLASDAVDAAQARFAELENIGAGLAVAGGALTAGLTVPIVGIGKAAIETAASFEQTKIAFTTLLHSSGAAEQMPKSLYDFAARTPFQIGGILSSSRMLVGMGFQAKELIPLMRTLGDAASGLGLGQEGMQRLIYHMGQIKSEGAIDKLILREMGQMGINAGQMLADGLGKTVPEVLGMIHKKAIDADTAIRLLTQGMDKRFGGGMEAQMKSFSRMLSNLQDNLTYTKNAIGEQLLPIAKVFEGFAGSLLESVKDLASSFGQLPEPVKVFSIALAGLAAAAGPLLVALGGITFAIGALAPVIVPIAGILGISVAAFAGWGVAIVGGIAALASLAYWSAIHWSSIKAVVSQAFAGIKEASGAFFGPTVAKLMVMWDAVKPYFLGTWHFIKDGLIAYWQTIAEAGKFIWGLVSGVFEKFIAVARTIPGVSKLLDLGNAWVSAEKLRISAEASAGALKHQGEQAAITTGHLKGLADAMKGHAGVVKLNPATNTDLIKDLEYRNKLEIQHNSLLRAEAQLRAFNSGVTSGIFGDEAEEAGKKVYDSFLRAQSSVKNLGDALKIVGDAATAPFEKISEAYKRLGVESSESLKMEAADAAKAYQTIKNSGTATADQLRDAWIASQQAQFKYSEAIDKTVSPLTRLNLAIAKFTSEKSKKGGILEAFGGNTFSTFQSSFNTMITGLVNGTVKFKNAFRGLGADMLASWGATLGKLLTDWVSHLALKLGRYILVNTGMLVSDAATAAASNSISIVQHIKDMLRYAEKAAGAAFSKAMELPFPINAIVAPVAAAGAFAGVLALSAVSAEHGAVLPNRNTIGMLHPNEMVLPAGISKGLQNMIAGGGPGGGVNIHQTNNYKGSPSMSQRQMDNYHKQTGKKLMSMARNRQFA